MAFQGAVPKGPRDTEGHKVNTLGQGLAPGNSQCVPITPLSLYIANEPVSTITLLVVENISINLKIVSTKCTRLIASKPIKRGIRILLLLLLMPEVYKCQG